MNFQSRQPSHDGPSVPFFVPIVNRMDESVSKALELLKTDISKIQSFELKKRLSE